MLERGQFLSKNVISMLKIAQKCTIFVKAKSAKNENQVALLPKYYTFFVFLFCTNDIEM